MIKPSSINICAQKFLVSSCAHSAPLIPQGHSQQSEPHLQEINYVVRECQAASKASRSRLAVAFLLHVLTGCLKSATMEANNQIGAVEQFSSARHHLGFYHNVGLSAALTCQALRSADLKATVFSALAIVIERHPALSSIVMDEDSNEPYFGRLPEINLETSVTFVTRQIPVTENGRDVELDTILEIQHNTSFKANHGVLPYWRLIIVTPANQENEFVASFIFHHSLGDGASGMAFHRDFLAALSSDPPPLTSNIIRPINRPLLPNLEVLLPQATPRSSTSPSPTALWSGSKVIPPTRSNFRSLAFTSDTHTAIVTSLQTARHNPHIDSASPHCFRALLLHPGHFPVCRMHYPRFSPSLSSRAH